jgi:hypothetical protein
MPIWLLAGLGDWFCHRASGIERTTGAKESIIHLLMFAEAGTALVVGLFLEVNALVLALFIVLFVLHAVTGWWDIGYANPIREITDIEQHIHGYLEVTPLIVLILVALLHWSQFLALFGMGADASQYAVEWKHQPLPLVYSVGVLGAAVILEIVPYTEELLRCLLASGGQLVPPDQHVRRLI